MSRVSVIVPCYNHAKYLPYAIESILSQTFRDLEILIVNDGSSDNTKEVAEALINSHSNCLIHLINQKNAGLADARNTGIFRATGEFILPLDADDRIAPEMIEVCMTHLRNEPSVDVIYTDRHDFEGGNEVHCLPKYNTYQQKYINLLSYCSLFRKRTWESVRGYRTNLRKSGEDWDFWIALDMEGCVIHKIESPLFWYRRNIVGLYQQVILEFDKIFAQIILNNPLAYEPFEVNAAQNFLRAIDSSMKFDERMDFKLQECFYKACLHFGSVMFLLVNAPNPASIHHAIRDYELALKFNSQGIEALNNIAIAYWLAGDRSKAFQAFDRLKELSSDEIIVHRNISLAERLRVSKDYINDSFSLLIKDPKQLAILSKIQTLAADVVLRTEPKAFSWGKKWELKSKLDLIAKKPSKRVLLCCECFWPSIGGTELFVEELGIQLLKQGFSVEVACARLEERTQQEHRGLKIHEFACKGDVFHGLTGEIQQYQEFMLQGEFDTVIVLGHPDMWMVAALAYLPDLQSRLIVMPSVNADNIETWTRTNVMNHVRSILMQADDLITVSESGCDAQLLSHMEIPSHFIPHAVEDVAISEDFRAQFNLPSDIPLLVMVANFWPVKNHLGLLEVITRLPGSWQLILIGGPSPYPNLQQYYEYVIAQTQQDSRIRFIGPLPPSQAAAAIRDADLLLVPSKGESAGPLVLLQAMLYGTPWIATPECNAVHDEAGGIIAPVYHFPEIIHYLIKHPEVRDKLGSLGQEHWQQCFRWEKSVEAFVSLISQGRQTIDLRMPGNLREQNQTLQQQVYRNLLPFQLRQSNLVVFPNWSESEELIGKNLADVIRTLVVHPNRQEILLLIDASTTDISEAELLLAALTMQLLTEEEELDISIGPEIALIGQLSSFQWSVLISNLQARIALANENEALISEIQADQLPLYLKPEDFRLRAINLIAFPDWSQPEDEIKEDLVMLIQALMNHPSRNQITLLLATSQIDEVQADQILSEILMWLSLEEDLTLEDCPEICLTGTLSSFQWQALIPLLQYRVTLLQNDYQALSNVGADRLPIYEIAS